MVNNGENQQLWLIYGSYNIYIYRKHVKLPMKFPYDWGNSRSISPAMDPYGTFFQKFWPIYIFTHEKWHLAMKKNGKWCINGEIPDLVTAKDLNFLSKPQHLHPRWIRVADPPQRASQLHHWDATFGSRNTSQVHDFYWISTIGFRWKYLEFSWGVFHGFSMDLRYL